MSGYDRRRAEIEADLRTNTALPVEEAGVMLNKLVNGLFDAREAALTEMAALLASDSPDPLAGAIREKWQSAIDRWVDPFSRILDGVQNPSTASIQWREIQVACENRFFRDLLAVGLGEERDTMVQLDAGLTKMTKDLQLKWSTMSDEAKRIEAAEAEAAHKMTEIVQQAMREGTEAWARYGEALQRFLEPFQKLPDAVNDTIVELAKKAGMPDHIAAMIPRASLAGKDYFALGKELGVPAKDLAAFNPELFRDPGMAVSETIQKLIGPEFEALVTAINGLYKYVLPIAAGTYAEQLTAYQRLVPNSCVILVSFGQTRRDVDDYLKNNGMEKTRDLYSRCEARTESWKDGVFTDGQKVDAAAFTREVGGSFTRRYEWMSERLNDFIKANQGRFIGSVSKSIENELLFSDIWVDRRQCLMDIGMDARIREWRAGVMVVDDQMATATSQLFSGLQFLPRDMNDLIGSRLNAYFDTLKSKLQREATTTGDTLAKAETLVSRDKIGNDLDRRAQTALLTA